MKRRTLLATAPFVLAAPSLRAQPRFPSRSVTLVVPFAAGGSTDAIARLIAEPMGRNLGQPVVVENASGAGGTIGAARVAHARPDGHTLLMHHIGHATSATLYRRLPYSVTDSFAPLGLVSDAAMTLVARRDFPAADLAAYIAEIRRRGDRLNLAHAGVGAANHLCGLLLQQAAGTAMTAVAFRGGGPAMTELVSGRMDVFCDQATSTAPFIRDGNVKGYAVTAPRRVVGLDLPTTAEAGQPGLLMSTWHGLYAPAGTPPEVQERLATALRNALQDGRVRQRLADLVTEPVTEDRATPTYHRRFLAEEVARWRPIIQAANEYAD
ncbi:tripartite tricarboxylate transporter substrate-binding protein [Pseudoroseomonas globiformis]|uniref:Tripartite tricarboxylate transporter substrate-binding protein n=1 Tax=Teichococcus globiformis TaxID=2307229 RepID=A0ABV7G826_9PROT